MKALGWWLMLVGSLRLASVWFGFFDIWALRLAVFSNATIFRKFVPQEKWDNPARNDYKRNNLPMKIQILMRYQLDSILPYKAVCAWFVFIFTVFVTEVHGRTFGVWTLLTCTLCFLCAFNLENKPLYLATFLSFIYAFGHFLTEYLIYQTMAIANLTTVSIFAGTSIIWMLLQWNAHQPIHTKHS